LTRRAAVVQFGTDTGSFVVALEQK